MTISTQARTAGPFSTNGSTTVFPFTFKVFAASDVAVVFRDNTTGAEATLVLGVDYTVTLNANQDANPGGSISTIGPAYPSGATLTLTSKLQYLQPTDLTNQGGFYPKVITNALDRLTIFTQQLLGLANRALKFPISDGNLDGTLPGKDQRKGKVLAFHETTGLPVAGPTIADTDTVAGIAADIAAVAAIASDVTIAADNVADITNFSDVYLGPRSSDPATRTDGSPLVKGDLYFNTNTDRLRVYTGASWSEANTGAVTVQRFTGDGATVSFQLNAAPDNENVVQVFIGGAYQSKTEYDITGVNADVLTFTAAPPNGAAIEAVTFSVLPLGVVDDSQVQMSNGLGTLDAWAAGVDAKVQFVNILDFIPKSQWAAIFSYTSTYDASDAFQAAMNSDGYVHIVVPKGKYRIAKKLNVTTQVTITGPDGGSQSMQHARLHHDPASTGPLFDVTTLVSGVCIKNLYFSGGNGSTCIVNAIPQARYEFLYWNEYNGGAIQLRSDFVIGSSSLRIRQCEWLGINAATNHIAYDIDCNGGDVLLEGLVAIRGSIGIDIKQGQTVRVVGCSVNKQSTYNNFSSRPDSQTAGIRLSGSGYKEAIEISGCYIEACTNGVYVEKCESLNVRDNLFQDVGVAGVVGAWEKYGNHAINILGANCNNVTIQNNYIRASSNGKAGVDSFYAVKVGASAGTVNYFNNYVETPGDKGTHYRFDSPVNWLGNKHVLSANPGTNLGAQFVNELSRTVKAFASFNGVGSISSTNYYNIASVVRNGTGDYTITTVANYPLAAVSLTAENGSLQAFLLNSVIQTSDNTFSVKTGTGFSTLADARKVNFAILG